MRPPMNVEVFINGVRYLPASQANSSVYTAIAREVISLYMARSQGESLDEYLDDKYLGVTMTEENDGSAPTMRQFVDNVMARLCVV